MAYRSNERSMPVESGGRGRGRESDSRMDDRMRGGEEENIRGIEDEGDEEFEDTEALDEEEEDDEGSV